MSTRLYVLAAIVSLVLIGGYVVANSLSVEASVVKGCSTSDVYIRGAVAIGYGDYIVYGGTYQALFIARVNVYEDTVYWAKAIGYSGVYGDYPEFRDAVVDNDYVYVTGYLNIGGGKQLCAARFNIVDGSMDWGIYLTGVSDTAGLGIAVVQDYVFIVGYTSDYSADGVDGFAVGLGKNNGTVLKAYRVDLRLLFDGSDEYIVDIALHGNTSYIVGMTNAYDTLAYDIVVANITYVGDNETVEQMFVVGNTGVYEIAGVGDWCCSGSSVTVDPLGYVWVIGEYKSSSGYYNTLVFRFTSNLSTIVFSKSLTALNPGDEFYATSIAIPPYRVVAYIGGYSVYGLHNSVNIGYIVRIHGNGSIDYEYSIHDMLWSRDYRLYHIPVYGDSSSYRVGVAGLVDSIASSNDIVVDTDLPLHSWSDYTYSITDKTNEAWKIEVYGVATDNLTQPIDITIDNPTTHKNIHAAVLVDTNPPPAITEPAILPYIIAALVIAILVITTTRIDYSKN